MLEPLSESRRKLLLSLGLCTPGDLRRAARHVRQLARGLPAFDSVWLDALVKIGRLTPFQARILDSSHPENIQLGPCVVIDRLGGGPLGETFLASTGRGHNPCVVKRLSAVERLSEEAEQKLRSLIDRLEGLTHPSVGAPMRCERVRGELAVVSRHVGGKHLAELLVRRGRFPPSVVWEIARQLADGLYALEVREVCHGDIRAANVRLDQTGTAALVDTGIRVAVDPELSVHSGLPPERYDGIAPELIGRVAEPSVASEMYALGCLLWQLLAGRPPFPGGDPLVKLAAHQTRVIDDVRQWSPATPPVLADVIRRLTLRDPAERPESFAEVVSRLGPPTWRGRRRLAAFRRWFDLPAPRHVERTRRSRSPRWLTLAGMLLVALVFAGVLQHEEARSVLVAWRAGVSSNWSSTAESDQETPEPIEHDVAVRGDRSEAVDPTSESDLLELPKPDHEGVVRLKAGEKYRARKISTVGALTIAADAAFLAEIIIGEEPLQLTAETVRIENVRLRRESSTRGDGQAALVRVQTQGLHTERCVIIASEIPIGPPGLAGPRYAPTKVGLAWKLVDSRDPQGGIATFRNTVFVGGDCALEINDPVRRVEFVNCLRLSGGGLAQLSPAAGARSETIVRLDRTTVRESNWLFRNAPTDGVAARGGLSVEANDCVFDLRPPRGCLFELSPELPTEAVTRIKLTGEGSLGPSTLMTARRTSTTEHTEGPAESQEIPVEGILAGPYRFEGPLSHNIFDAAIKSYNAPRRSASPPGITPAELPAVAPARP